MAKKQIRRNFKDSLFRMIFREKKELLNLYEAQSTWNPNMPLRGVFYFSQLYRGYLEGNHLDSYSKVQLKLPLPRYLVFYNGLKTAEDVMTLRLSDSFVKKNDREYALECVATLLNINYGHNETVMKNCRKLYEYSYLVAEIRKNLDRGVRLDAAVDQAVEACIRQGILEDFLRKHRAEVNEVILEEYDQELHIKSEKELSYLEGKAEGIEEGKAEVMSGVIRIIRRKLAGGMSAGEVAELLEMEPDNAGRAEALLRDYPEETDMQIAMRYLKAADSAGQKE